MPPGLDYESLLQLMRTRRSIRRFEERAVSRGDLERLIEAARWAPSNSNRQPWKFLVLDDRPRIRALAGAIHARLTERMKRLPPQAADYAAELLRYATVFDQAPVLIVALHKHPASALAQLLEGLPNPELISGEPLSVSMAVQNLLLAAQALGLGACVLTAPLLAVEAVAEALGPAPDFAVTCLVAVGYPDESPVVPRRKSLDHILEYLVHPDL